MVSKAMILVLLVSVLGAHAHAQAPPPEELNFEKLWREIQGMKAQIAVLEQQNKDLQSRAHAQAPPPEDLSIEKLWREFQDMKAQMAVLEQQNKDLLSQKKVAFSASLLSTGQGNTYANDGNLIYKKVYTNVGEGYNSDTGVFTAPVSGVYFFRFYAHCHTGNKMAVSLYKGTKVQCSVFSERPITNGNAANAVVLTLEKGEEVYTRLWPGTWVYDDESSYTSFTGFLLFEGH
ncbi:complement C1q tumor necrosis factor-related protein 3-like [Engraulis encrasicolus]|uniref:complement C1q tumor necrosis factor-related protein 3-like n=1 Tax=Engraulis encrasicolus TaxID=184585 RepID=UPI002FD23AA6